MCKVIWDCFYVGICESKCIPSLLGLGGGQDSVASQCQDCSAGQGMMDSWQVSVVNDIHLMMRMSRGCL